MWREIIAGLLILGISYVTVRIITMALSPKRILFISPKLGQIITVVKNGENWRYYTHLKGLTAEFMRPDGTYYPSPAYIDEMTGKILPGEENIRDWWWRFFSVRWIGLNTVRWYDMPVAIKDENGKVIGRKMVKAKSLHFAGSYPVLSKDQETSDGIKGDLYFNIILQLTDAAEASKYSNWYDEKVLPSALAVSEEYVLNHEHKQLLAERNESSNSLTTLLACMRVLNTDRVGNLSLMRQVGMMVTGVNQTQLAFDDLVANAMEAERIAELNGKAGVATAKKEADEKVEEARGLTALETARTNILEHRVAILAKDGGKLAAAMEQTKMMSDAIKGHTGPLALGNSAVPTIPLE